jgi:ABC-2 type transport system ATP-binding protein
VIEVRNLSKYYGRHTAIEDVSFRAERGEILGFLGPNGAGKTTTMRILTCYLPPSGGQASVAGYDVLEEPMEVRRRIGYLPERVPLYNDLTVDDYLNFVGELKGMPRSQRVSRIGHLMEQVGILHVRDRTVGKLSKGYRQRVGLAQALVNDPEVLILDEPTVGLDPQQIVEIRNLIRNLAGKRTIILSTHILPEVSLLCRRVIIINNGKLITVDSPDNLKNRLSRSMALDLMVRGREGDIVPYLESLPDVKSVRRLAGESGDVHKLRLESSDNRDIREVVSRAVVERGFGLLQLKAIDMSLEDIFVQLVTKEETN